MYTAESRGTRRESESERKESEEEIRLAKVSKNRDKLINELLGIEEQVTEEEVIEEIVEKGLLNKINSYFK